MTSEYEVMVTVQEPRERATMYHAADLCRHCGLCVTQGVRGEFCPGKLHRSQIVLSVQGYGPARNIVAFTGGDLTCRAEFYAELLRRLRMPETSLCGFS